MWVWSGHLRRRLSVRSLDEREALVPALGTGGGKHDDGVQRRVERPQPHHEVRGPQGRAVQVDPRLIPLAFNA